MLGLVNNKFIIGKEEYYCSAAEMHYFRTHKRYWAVCFERIKKAGFTMISTVVPWTLHEEEIGSFDFAGINDSGKDLIVFLELAREFGFKVILRCGPYSDSGLPNGGVPNFVFSDSNILARNSNGDPLKIVSNTGEPSGFVQSYLHPNYLNHFKRFFTVLVESIQNYIYPKGPVFLMHIDENLDFGGNKGIFDGDYSDFSVNERFISFLESKYGEIGNLNIIYGKKLKKFSEVEAPKEVEIKKPEELLPYFDWIEFKEQTVNEHVRTVRERLESLGVGALYSTGVSIDPDLGMPLNWKSITDHKVSLGLSLEENENYYQNSRMLRYLNSTSNFNWASKLISGSPNGKTRENSNSENDDKRALRFLLTTALSGGIKGFVSYMFVEHDRWLGSPLGEDGTVRETYELLSKLNEVIPRMKLEDLKDFASVGIAYDRSLLYYKYLKADGPYEYLNYLLDFCIPGTCRGFGQLNYDYKVLDTQNLKDIEGLKLIFIPIAEYMPEEIQESIVDVIKSGVNVILIGTMPTYNEFFRSSNILSKSLGISTRRDGGFGKIQIGSQSYDTQLFGSISKKNSSWRIFAKLGNKIVGAYRRLGKGSCYVFTFDPGLTYDNSKKEILNKLFSTHRITTPVVSSEPDVDVIAQSDQKKHHSLYLVNHNQRYHSPSPDNLRRVVIKIDSSLIGSSGSARFKLYDVFSDEERSCTARELTEGLFVEIENMDSKILLIEKR
ncbi:MAG: hypothetical protein GF315_04055 [candidate division Zixibacteria bacterium]|nr:hypothetical protein [candidate division Zixibacteria bacterium]